ncbi:MAG: BACON domain-containing protein [Blastocatellia bacterium]
MFQIDRQFTAVKPEGSSFVVNLAATASCPWTASSDVNWISFPSGATGTGNQPITVQAAPNVGRSRSGYVTIAGRRFEVYQDAPCSFLQLIDWSGTQMDAAYAKAAGGYHTLVFQTGSGCPLVVKSSLTWLKLDSTRDSYVNIILEKKHGAAPTRRNRSLRPESSGRAGRRQSGHRVRRGLLATHRATRNYFCVRRTVGGCFHRRYVIAVAGQFVRCLGAGL